MGKLEREIIKSKKTQLCSRFNISVLFFGDYDCGNLFVSPEGDEKVLSLPLLEGDEEKYNVPSLALAKGVKQGKGKIVKRSENLNFKQTINHTYNTIITNRTWKQVTIKTRNQTNTIVFVSA